MKENSLDIDSRNPRLQCLKCGKWKRLTGRDKDGSQIQRFFPCINKDCKYYGYGSICSECCTGDVCKLNTRSNA